MPAPAFPPAGLQPLLSRSQWKRRLALWGGAVLVALVALLFAKASDAAFSLFRHVLALSPWWALAFRGDSRTVVRDDSAPYYGAQIEERTLIPVEGAQIFATTLEEWLPLNPPRV